MKFALCGIAGIENLYIREWVEHHIKLGFDKIIIYTNIPSENPNMILFDYVMKGIVEIIPWYIQIQNYMDFTYNVQCYAYNDCLERYKTEYDWIAFFDIDEFLNIDCGDIHTWFNSMPIYNDFDSVVVNWYTMDGNGKLYYEDKPVCERFTHHNNFIWRDHDSNVDCIIKSIVKTDTKYKFVESPHKLYGDCGPNPEQLHICTTDGYYTCGFYTYMLNFQTHNHARLNHYITKSLSEFIYKKIKNIGWNIDVDSPDIIKNLFMEANEWTPEHQMVFDKYIASLKQYK